MARIIEYKYRQTVKQIPFSYDLHHSMLEAIASQEGIDLQQYHQTLAQLKALPKNSQLIKSFEKEFLMKHQLSDLKWLKPCG